MNPIEALMNNDPAGFRDSVSHMLMQKLGDRLDLERINVAQNLFGESEPEFDSEVESDEVDNNEEAFDDEEEVFGDDEQDDFFSDDEE